MVVSIQNLKEHLGESVTVQGWLAGSRSSGKIAFLQLRDGSGFVQGVLAKNDVDEETFKLARSLTQESSLIVTGEVRADERSPSGVELGVTGLELVAQTEELPHHPERTRRRFFDGTPPPLLAEQKTVGDYANPG